jgi:hypothetical protein
MSFSMMADLEKKLQPYSSWCEKQIAKIAKIGLDYIFLGGLPRFRII